jgi:FKBP-type peptidyl-prolyl cis-trans isomerase FklB
MNVMQFIRTIAIVGVIASGVPAVATEPPRVVPIDEGATGLKDAKSYALGWKVGKDMAGAGLEVEDFQANEFADGFIDALSKKGKLNDDQLQSAFIALQDRIQKKMIDAARKNLEKANDFLKTNKDQEGVQTTKSGLQYLVLKSGKGKTPTLTSVVKVHYEGKLLDGTIFDSSIQANEPAQFPVNRVVSGWTEALQRMKVGDKWKLFIPPGLAYGEQGYPPDIGPNELLIFELELLDVVK